jgi:hypothetical protein
LYRSSTASTGNVVQEGVEHGLLFGETVRGLVALFLQVSQAAGGDCGGVRFAGFDAAQVVRAHPLGKLIQPQQLCSLALDPSFHGGPVCVAVPPPRCDPNVQVHEEAVEVCDEERLDHFRVDARGVAGAGGAPDVRADVVAGLAAVLALPAGGDGIHPFAASRAHREAGEEVARRRPARRTRPAWRRIAGGQHALHSLERLRVHERRVLAGMCVVAVRDEAGVHGAGERVVHAAPRPRLAARFASGVRTGLGDVASGAVAFGVEAPGNGPATDGV